MFLAGKARDVELEMARLKRGQSVLDRMGDRFASLKSRLSAHDQQQVADYAEAVRDMEKQLKADEAYIAGGIDAPKNVGVVDLAGTRFMAPGDVGDMEMRDEVEVGFDGGNQVAIHDLHMIDII